MAYAKTATYGKITLAVEADPVGSAGTYSTICGITSWSYTENTELENNEIPDCDDPDLPFQIEKAVRAVGASASCEGVWALSSHQFILGWSRGGEPLNVRITFATVSAEGVATDTETLTGPAYLTNLSLQGNKGQRWQSSFGLDFDGLPVAALKGP